MTKDEALEKAGFDFNDPSTFALDEAMEMYASIRAIEYNRWVQTFENSNQARKFHNVETNEELYSLFNQQSK